MTAFPEPTPPFSSMHHTQDEEPQLLLPVPLPPTIATLPTALTDPMVLLQQQDLINFAWSSQEPSSPQKDTELRLASASNSVESLVRKDIEPPPQQEPLIPTFRPALFYPNSSLYSTRMINNQQAPPPQPKRPTFSTPRVQIADNLYVATYSNIEVYEFEVNGTAVMRRKSDDWINGTHILKAAGIEKGRRTKILEKEVQGEPHEKIQGGYGRYQGTWYVQKEKLTLFDALIGCLWSVQRF